MPAGIKQVIEKSAETIKDIDKFKRDGYFHGSVTKIFDDAIDLADTVKVGKTVKLIDDV